ncbi:MAG: amidase [Chloroflexi bacterium]|nr:MAG: amidase [Chloroflexota bacterium]
MTSLVRRSLVLATLAALLLGVLGASAPTAIAAQPTSTRVAGIDVDASTIPQLQSLMNRHRLTSVELVQFYLHRIQRLNPRLHAVIVVSPTALADARRADALRRGGDHRPLLGIPIIVKDNIDTTGMPTTAGSWSLADSRPSDAFVVGRLRAAGALIIGKANLSEWANFRSIPSSSGWSGIGGQTNMPYVLDRNPCGSSSGSGVAAAADLAVAAVGTETDGSVVCPSGANGIVGIKPTVGLVSRSGIVPITADQDTSGPMARNVTDAAVLLGAMTGIDPTDPATAGQAGHAFTNYTQFLDAHALEGARIGIWRKDTYGDLTKAQMEPVLADAIDALEAQGATVIDPTDIDLTAAFTSEFTALECEFKTDLPAYFAAHTAAGYPRTLQDVIDFNDTHPNLEGPWNSQIFIDSEATGGRSDPDCQAARANATSGTQAALNDVMTANDLDAIVALTNGPAWVTNSNPLEGDLDGNFLLFVGSSTASAVAGYGTITVPAAYIDGLPIGISFIGGAWDEPQMIAFGYDFEQATHVRVPPTFVPTIGPNTTAGPAVASRADRAALPGRGGRSVMMPVR